MLVPQNRYSEQAFRNRPALTAWRTRLVPSALALFVVQNPLEDRLPDGTKMDSDSRQWFIHANDAIGVRARARVLAALVEKYIHNESENNWVSGKRRRHSGAGGAARSKARWPAGLSHAGG